MTRLIEFPGFGSVGDGGDSRRDLDGRKGCARGGRTVRRMWRTRKNRREGGGGKKAAEMWGGFDGESWQVQNQRGGGLSCDGEEKEQA